jgi:hypothetical protein
MKTTTFLAAAALALMLAGCGSSPKTASTGANAPSAGNFASAAYEYAACIRSHGVPNFPNPQVVKGPHSQGIRQAVPAGVGTSPKFVSAQKACKGILPMPENESPAERAAQQHEKSQNLLAFAQCLRAHGVAGFPDPTAEGQITPTMLHAAGVDIEAPSFLTAAKACVGVTHGQLTIGQIEEFVKHPNGGHSSSGAGEEGPQSSGGSAEGPQSSGGQ